MSSANSIYVLESSIVTDPERKHDRAASVVIVVEDLPVPFDRRVWQEANSLRRAGYTVSVICPRALGFDAEVEELDGIHIRRYALPTVPSSARGYVREYVAALTAERRLLRRVRGEFGIDVIHLCNPPDVLFIPAVWHKLVRRSRVVFDHHDRSPELYAAKFGKKDVFHTALALAERCTFALADVVIAPNETHAHLARTRGRKRPEDVFIVRSSPTAIPNAAELPTSPPEDGVHRIGYLGVMGEQDGVDILLRAADQVVRVHGHADAKFLLMGGGPAYDRLVALRDELGLQGHVEFMGYCARPEVVRILSTCEVCVCPDPKNEYNDGCTMNKVLEYMQLGRPIVQFDLAESRRLVGDAGVYASGNSPDSLAEGIVSLLSDRDLANRIGAAGRERFSQYEWPAQESSLFDAYRRALRT
jgi:glycosyltransferase involved in cell wall biosynthesis